MPADITICIPTWQAEAFIDRTLRCARAQTHEAVRILISVDLSTDATEAICREHARADPRIEVMVQPERRGWSQNANLLLDRVDTPLFFLYFHDDIIEPTYVERLRGALAQRPAAMSAHCDLARFGNEEVVDLGYDYRGSACRRLINFFVGPIKGTPLRSLTRAGLLSDGLRFPLIAGDGFWRCHPFLLRLLAAGPAVRVPEVLYRRWIRDGSMTTTWNPQRAEELVDGQRESARLGLPIVEGAPGTEAERRVLHHCFYLFLMMWTRRHERLMGNVAAIDPRAISPAVAEHKLPPALDGLEPEVAQWIEHAGRELTALEELPPATP